MTRRRPSRSRDLAAVAERLAATMASKRAEPPASLKPENYVRVEGVAGIWFGSLPEAIANRPTTKLKEL